MKLFLGLVVAIISGYSLVGCVMNSAEQNPAKFRFEDYRDEKSLVDAILRLHPAGSPVNDLLQTLKRAGAKCEVPVIKGRPNADTVICTYRAGSIVTKDWQVGVNTHDKGVRISYIYASFYLTGP